MIPAWMWVRKWTYLLKGLFLAVENSSTIMLVCVIFTMLESISVRNEFSVGTQLESNLYLYFWVLLRGQLFGIPPYTAGIQYNSSNAYKLLNYFKFNHYIQSSELIPLTNTFLRQLNNWYLLIWLWDHWK